MSVKKNYEKPEIAVTYFSPADVMTASGDGDRTEWDIHPDS